MSEVQEPHPQPPPRKRGGGYDVPYVIRERYNQLGYLGWIISVSALILFGCSSLRHELFQSTAFDLGIFDQAVYLISQGQTPISSFIGFHILGDHATWIFYCASAVCYSVTGA